MFVNTPYINRIVMSYVMSSGINVEYAMPLPGFPSGPTVLHHMLLLWTGDHVAQCEVSKGLFCGQRGCRFCHLTGWNLYHLYLLSRFAVPTKMQVKDVQSPLTTAIQTAVEQPGFHIHLEILMSLCLLLILLIRKRDSA